MFVSGLFKSYLTTIQSKMKMIAGAAQNIESNFPYY